MATGRTGMRAAAKPLLSNARVRDALLSASGLSPAPEDDLLPVPRSRSGSHWVHEMLSRLAYVQVDPIVAVERAHHHILFTRNPRYRREDLRRKRVREVVVEGADGDRLEGFFALDAVLQRLDAFPEPPRGLRLLNPFDPVVHDRGTGRSEQLFGFDFRMEIWVPPHKRVYGYYVLPILEGRRFTGRVEVKLDRERGVLNAPDVWWERGVTASVARKQALRRELAALARFVRAKRVRL